MFLRDVTEQKEAQEAIGQIARQRKTAIQAARACRDASLTINSATSEDSVLGVIKNEARHIIGAKSADVFFNGEGARIPQDALGRTPDRPQTESRLPIS